MTTLEVERHDEEGRVRLALRGELDLSTAQMVEDELRRAEEAAPAVLVLDLRELSFLDSTGLRLIVTADARAREAGNRFALVRGTDPVQRVFAITRLEERLDFVDDPSAL